MGNKVCLRINPTEETSIEAADVKNPLYVEALVYEITKSGLTPQFLVKPVNNTNGTCCNDWRAFPRFLHFFSIFSSFSHFFSVSTQVLSCLSQGKQTTTEPQCNVSFDEDSVVVCFPCDEREKTWVETEKKWEKLEKIEKNFKKISKCTLIITTGPSDKSWVKRTQIRLLLPPWWEELQQLGFLESTSPLRSTSICNYESEEDDLKKEDISFHPSGSGFRLG